MDLQSPVALAVHEMKQGVWRLTRREMVMLCTPTIVKFRLCTLQKLLDEMKADGSRRVNLGHMFQVTEYTMKDMDTLAHDEEIWPLEQLTLLLKNMNEFQHNVVMGELEHAQCNIELMNQAVE